MKLFTKTFGCQMNFADSDEFTRHFKARGFQSTENEEEADAILVNTCTVRELAEHKAMSFVGRLREWKKAHSKGMIVVTGCAAERTKDEIKRKFPFIDLVVGAKDIDEFEERLGKHLKDEPKQTKSQPAEWAVPMGTKVVQFVNTMRGCNYNCTYCIVPSVRGREVYLPVEKILSDVKERLQEGAKEIWLLGQTVNSYRPENPIREGYDFSDLLRDVSAVPGLERLRFMSPHPYYLTPKLVRAMAECPPVCEHIHLPVQSGSNTMLQKMKRNYTRESYLAGIRKLRDAIPSMSITTDIIVGFPGETEADFEQTLQLVKEADFDSAYCFKYSPRPGTVAAEWTDDIPEEVKEARVNHLLSITEDQGQRKAKELIDTEQQVLLEEDKGDGVLRGKTRGPWRVRTRNSDLKIGQLVNVRITGSHSRELHGDISHVARP